MKPSRSILSVPGHRETMHEKASASAADVIMLDLEDSVPVNEKARARQVVVRSILGLNWQGKTLAVRINGTDTPFGFRDAVEVAGAAGDRIDVMVLPKVNSPGDVHFLDRLLSGIEMETGRNRAISIEAAIETAQGLDRVSDIARATQRLRSLSFGVADYTASVGAGLASVSGHGENEATIYPGHRWHFPLSRMVMAAKARDLLAIDAPYGNFRDAKGLAASAAMAKALGCNGKWAIHPDQIPTINEIFSPAPEEIARAKKILAATGNDTDSKGAVGIDGKMVDQATIRLARDLWAQAKYLGLAETEAESS